MEAQKQMGIKETKELVSGVMRTGGLLYSKFKDGVQAKDIEEIFEKIRNDAELRKAMVDAYNGADQVGAEMKDLSVKEGIELGAHILEEGSTLIQTLKGA